jgi:ABC-type polysaccharide/polyol phosphate transport system ATPase subunit
VGPSYGVEVEDLGKAYRLYRGPLARIAEGATLGRVKGHSEFWALRNIDFKLRRGASLGLCGANGAGKSTLLKVLSGITAPSEGRLRMNGRVASLLELGAGFHLDFTGRANIMLNGVMMGFTRREMLARMDAIIDFAELGGYIDAPVRTYSSGMGLRLGFAIAISVDPDILIIDEVFAVGDMYFQKKCVDRIYDFKRRGKTILFCSHSLYDIRQLCDEAIWIRDGRAASIGDAIHVTNEYTSYQRQHIDDAAKVMEELAPDAQAFRESLPDRVPRVRSARIYRMGTDQEVYEIQSGDSIEVRVWWENPDPVAMPIHLGVGFIRQDTTLIAGVGTHFDKLRLSGAEGCTVLRFPRLPLLAGQFLLPVVLLDEGGVHKYHEYLMPENLVIRAHTKDVGLVRLERDWVLSAKHAEPGRDEAAAVGRGAEAARS